MMKTSHILTLAACLMLFQPVALPAKRKAPAVKQTTAAKDTVPAGTVDRKFKPVLEPVERILVLPEPETENIQKQPLNFSIAESPATLKGEYTPLPAADILQTFPASAQLGYARIGVGGHKTFSGDVQLNLLRRANQSFDVNFRHRSVYGDVLFSDLDESRAYNNDNELLLNYRQHTAKNELSVGLGERVTFWNYYGHWNKPASPFFSGPSEQWSTDGLMRVGLKSKTLEDPLTYDVWVEGHLFRLGRGLVASTGLPADNTGARERDFRINGLFKYAMGGDLELGVKADIRNFSYRPPVSWTMNAFTTYDQTIIDNLFADRRYVEIHPYVSTIYNNWIIKGGLKLSIPSLTAEKVHFNLTGSVMTPINEKTILRLNLDGGVDPHSYREGLEMNRFLDPGVRLKSSWEVGHISAGIDYRPYNNLRISPEAGFGVTTDVPFFLNAFPGSTNLVNQGNGRFFTAEYMSSTRFHIGANARYSLENLLSVQASVQYNQYWNGSKDAAIQSGLDSTAYRAWYKPGLEMQLRADINPNEQVSIFAEYRLEALRYAPTEQNFSQRIGDIHVLNIGAGYKLSKGVGVFLHVNNLLDQRYEVFYACPAHGFTAELGGSVTF